MPWKMSGENIAMQDGKPIWINAEGAEAPFDAEHALSKIGQLNGENAAKKRELNAAMEKLKALDGVDNPAEFMASARKAMETVANLDAKKLIDAGEVEKVKAEVTKAMQAKLDELQKLVDTKDATLAEHIIGGGFSGSKFIAEQFAASGPAGAEIARALFQGRFKVEDGKPVAYDEHGQKIFSREKPGDLAGFDEALKIIVDAYPHKASILKGSDASGGGAGGSGGKPGGAGGGRSVSRAQFDTMDPSARMEHVKAGGVITD